MHKFNDFSFKNSIEKITLSNGIKIILDHDQKSNLTASGFYLNKGSRDEDSNQNGYSHFCEHMIFKGTSILNKKNIACQFDKMGGFFNAYTTNELIVIYNVIPYFYLYESLSFISELITDSVFDKDEIDLEREVIINEIRSDMEDPQEIVYEDFMKNIFNDHPLGLPIIGNENSVKNAKRDDLYMFYLEKFIAVNLLIVISGRFEKHKIIDFFEKLFFIHKEGAIKDKVKTFQTNGKFSFTVMNSQQLHLIAGTTKFKINTDDYHYYSLVNLMLGESMSSILFQKIREELGLCYSIYSFINKYRDAELFGIYMSTMSKNADKIIKSVSDIFKDLKKSGFGKEELENAKEQKIVELVINNDIIQKRLNRIAFTDIMLKKDYNIENMIGQINLISHDRINEMIRSILDKDNFFVQGLYKKNIKLREYDF